MSPVITHQKNRIVSYLHDDNSNKHCSKNERKDLKSFLDIEIDMKKKLLSQSES